MTHAQTPKVVKKKLFSPIWLLPLVALALGAWLGVKSIKESGVEIRIHFPNATGVDVGKTLVRYQGLTVGKVVDVSIDEALKGVNVDVLMDYRSAPFLSETTKFWLVAPKASITGVEGLDALFSGNYISIQPGEGDSQSFFEAETTAPVILPGAEGLIVNLSSEKLGSLDVGSPVFYRQIPVGQIVGYRLEGSKEIIISAFVEQQYAHLVKTESQFWNVSGINIDASLSGIKVNSESLASILAGGISFSSADDAEPAKNGQNFALYNNKDNALGGIEFTLSASNADAIAANASIVFRGVLIGRVTDKVLSETGVTLKAKLDSKYQELLTQTAKFWVEGAEISLEGIKHPERLITGSVINFQPGVGAAKEQYSLLNEAPEADALKKLLLTLTAENNPGVSAGAEVRYKQIKIGEVISAGLNASLTAVNYEIEVLAEFASLITKNSYFVAESALSIDASLDKVQVKTRDLTTLTKGAISLIQGKSRSLIKSGQTLPIFSGKEEAERFFAQQNLVKISLHSLDGADLNIGSPIYYKKMKIGQVDNIQWVSATQDFSIELSIQKQFNNLVLSNSVFWRNSALSVDASLQGIEVQIAPLQGALTGSISLGLLETGQKGNQSHLYESRSLAMAQSEAITLTFAAEVKLASGAPIRYLGHKVGEIDQVILNTDLNTVKVMAYLYGRYADQFTQTDANYYLVDAQISLAGIKAAETLITGPYIGVTPGVAAAKTSSFNGQLQASFYNNQAAVTFALEDADLGSVKAGTALFFRGVKIGQIDSYQLSAQGTSVLMNAHVDAQYRHLINRTSQFWDLAGVKVDLGLFSGAQIETGSLETILAGGIGVATEETSTPENSLTGREVFRLNSSPEPDWKRWAPIQNAL